MMEPFNPQWALKAKFDVSKDIGPDKIGTRTFKLLILNKL